MKKLPRRYKKELSPVTLYRDDLEHVFEMLSDFKELKIQDGMNEYDSPKDFIESNKASKSKLSISSYDDKFGYFEISIKPDIVEISGGEASYALCAAVSDFLSSRVKWYSLFSERTWLQSFASSLFGGGLSAGVFFLWVMFAADGENSKTWLLLALVASALFLVHWFDLVHAGRTALHFVARSESRSFIARKWDDIVLVVITAVVTTILNQMFS